MHSNIICNQIQALENHSKTAYGVIYREGYHAPGKGTIKEDLMITTNVETTIAKFKEVFQKICRVPWEDRRGLDHRQPQSSQVIFFFLICCIRTASYHWYELLRRTDCSSRLVCVVAIITCAIRSSGH